MCGWNKKQWQSFWLLEVRSWLAFTNTCLKCILKLLWTWVLFDDGSDALKILKQEEQYFTTNCIVVTLAMHWCLTTPARLTNWYMATVCNNRWIILHRINQQRKYNSNYWTAWLFQGLCSPSAMNADRCKQRRGRNSPLIFRIDMSLEEKTSHSKLAWEVTTGSTPEFKQHLMEQHPTTSARWKEFKSVLSAGKIMVTDFWVEKGVSLVSFFPSVTTVNSNCYTETLSLNACLCWVHPPWKKSKVLLLHDNGRLHKCVQNRGHHKFWMANAATSTL